MAFDGKFLTCCGSPFYAMSNASRSLVVSDKHERVGPDYFGYYSSEAINLLSQDEDVLPVATQTSELPRSKSGEGKKNSINHSDNSSGSLYSNGVGAGLSDFKKDRLRSLLRQSVTALSSEVDEVVDPVFATYHLQSRLKSNMNSLNHTATAFDDVVQIPCKKLKVSSSSSSASLHAQTSDVSSQCNRKGNDSHLGSNIGLDKETGEVNDDLQFLLENDSAKVEEMVKKYSNELSGTVIFSNLSVSSKS